MITPGADGSQIRFCDFDGYIFGVSGTSVSGQKLDFKPDIHWIWYSRKAISPFQITDGKEVTYPISFTFTEGDARIDDNPNLRIDYIGFDMGINETGKDIYIKLDMFDSPLIAFKHTTEVADVAVDEVGCAYVAGEVEYKRRENELNTLFAMKLNPERDGWEYLTYFGDGSLEEIEIDSQKNLYLTGIAAKTGFPLTENAFDTIQGEYVKGFVLKLNDSGREIIYSSLLGGSGDNVINAIQVTSEEKSLVTGRTRSPDFPTTNNAYSRNTFEHQDMFLSVINIEGSDLEYSTYFGGSNWDEGIDLKQDSFGNIVIVGLTSSKDFSASEVYSNVELLDDYYFDVYYTIFSKDYSYVKSNLIGGNKHEYLTDMSIDNENNIYISGYTKSEDFFTTDGSGYHGGKTDYYILKIDKNGNLIWSKLIGGNDYDQAFGIQTDDSGNTFITGYTRSLNYPVMPGEESGNGFFLSVIDTYGKNLIYSTYIGRGTSRGLALSNNDEIFLWRTGNDIISENGLFSENNIFFIKMNLTIDTSVTDDPIQPKAFSLHSPYPNPFNSSVTISYQLFQDSNVTLYIYNIYGQRITTIVDKFQQKGLYNIQWNGNDYPSGMYFYQLKVGDEMNTGKLMYLK